MLKKLLFLQGLFYLVTGLWPLIHVQSFMEVTGPKTDIWLVKMISLLTISIALNLLSQRRQKYISPLLSVSSAAGFLTIDVYYALTGTISKIYLADAVLELIFVVSGLYALLIMPRKRQ